MVLVIKESWRFLGAVTSVAKYLIVTWCSLFSEIVSCASFIWYRFSGLETYIDW